MTDLRWLQGCLAPVCGAGRVTLCEEVADVAPNQVSAHCVCFTGSTLSIATRSFGDSNYTNFHFAGVTICRFIAPEKLLLRIDSIPLAETGNVVLTENTNLVDWDDEVEDPMHHVLE
jgi:hypothetical protein